MRFVSGIVLGIVLMAGTFTLTAQNERAMHPRIAKAIVALKDAKAYMENAPHDFGGHKVDALRASDEAIRELNLAPAISRSRGSSVKPASGGEKRALRDFTSFFLAPF